MIFLKKTFNLFFLACLLTFVACKEDAPVVDCENYHWAYEGEEAPDTWNNCFLDCGGEAQSPVNIAGAIADAGLMDLHTEYEAVPVELINNGHTVEFEYEAGSHLTLNGETFNLLQFHFHTQSEHTIDGVYYPMEAHLVHKNEATGALAVIGIMIEEGNENEFLKTFSDNLPAAEDDHYSNGSTVSVSSLLPADGSYFTYGGSLTTPPCSEIVTWFVMKNPVQASSEQISNFHSAMHDNNRPVQGLNGRTISEH